METKMQRRSFIQALSAAFAVPTIGLTFTPNKPAIRWDLWTDPISVRYDLSTPWVVNNATFATDGRALICSPGCDGEAAGEQKVPGLNKLPWDDFDKGGWYSSRDFIRVPARMREMVCPHCFGYGVVGNRTLCDCDDIIWNGNDIEPEGTCAKCKDTGWIGTPCAHCIGGWIHRDPYKLQIGGKHFCAGLVAKFQTLGDFDCLLTEKANQTCMLVRFDGGRGMLMGLRDA